LLVALILVGGTALAERTATAPEGVAANRVITCDLVSQGMGNVRPSGGDRVVLGRIAVPGRYLPGLFEQEWPLRYWRKAGILVRPGKTPVDIIVPPAWRSRLVIQWGEPAGPASSLRITGCPGREVPWLPYGGGFNVAAPSCVPLIVRSGGRSQTLRFGIGRRCP
jgi:hypothetical protein